MSVPTTARRQGRSGAALRWFSPHVLFQSTDLSLPLTATVPLRCDGRDVEAHFTHGEGESAVSVLGTVGGDAGLRGCSGTEAEELFDATVTHWRR